MNLVIDARKKGQNYVVSTILPFKKGGRFSIWSCMREISGATTRVMHLKQDRYILGEEALLYTFVHHTFACERTSRQEVGTPSFCPTQWPAEPKWIGHTGLAEWTLLGPHGRNRDQTWLRRPSPLLDHSFHQNCNRVFKIGLFLSAIKVENHFIGGLI